MINADDGSAGDTVTCGDGEDTVSADDGDAIASDCEHVIQVIASTSSANA